MAADLVIAGGMLVDGTGAPARRADVAVSDGRVVAIGTGLSGRRVLDARDRVVAPGFIDIHTHYDAQVFWDRTFSPSCHHGVTTVVAGNCGFSLAPTRPSGRDTVVSILETVEDMDAASLAEGIVWEFETFPEYLAAVERRGVALNFTAYVGHSPLRLFVMGDDFQRQATPDELVAMQRLLDEAMDAGAAGLASSFGVLHQDSSGRPVPSRFADRSEIEALLSVLRRRGHGVFTVNPGGPCTPDALYALQPVAGVPITYGALLSDPEGAYRRHLERNRRAHADGVQVWPQVTPRPVGVEFTLAQPSTLLAANPVFRALVGVSLDERRAAYANPSWRDDIVAAFDTQERLRPRWELYTIARSAAHPDLVGAPLTDVATRRGDRHPFLTLLDLALDEPDLAVAVHGIVSNEDTDAVAELLRDEHCTLGLSDAGAHVSQLCDAAQATEFLGLWVRDRGLMPLEQAVAKLTSVQADLMGFADRGRLHEGAWADIVVFDPDTVAPGPMRRVRDFPAGAERITVDAPSGVHHVLVNGIAVREDEQPTTDALDRLPGRIVRRP